MLTDLAAEQIRALGAEPETDALVAWAIGWEWWNGDFDGERIIYIRPLHVGPGRVFAPTGDPSAAKQATDAMAERTGWDWSLYSKAGKFHFTWYTPLAHARHIHVDAAPTEELARCRAVLLAAKEKR